MTVKTILAIILILKQMETQKMALQQTLNMGDHASAAELTEIMVSEMS